MIRSIQPEKKRKEKKKSVIRTDWRHVIGLVILVLANCSTASGAKCAVWTPHYTCLKLVYMPKPPMCFTKADAVCLHFYEYKGNTFCIYATDSVMQINKLICVSIMINHSLQKCIFTINTALPNSSFPVWAVKPFLSSTDGISSTQRFG